MTGFPRISSAAVNRDKRKAGRLGSLLRLLFGFPESLKLFSQET